MRYLIKSIFVFIAVFASSHTEASEEVCLNQGAYGVSNTIKELVSDSSFIAIYKAEKPSVKLDERTCCRFVNELYEIEFTLLLTLKGKAPDFYKTKSTVDILDTVPSSFFRVHDEHSRLIRKQGSLGLHSEHTLSFRTQDQNCYYGPKSIVIGYEYLIFGGVNSPVSFEPILNIRTDPLLAEVKRELAESEVRKPN